MENQVLVIGSTCVDVIIRVDHLPHTEENLHPDGQQFAIGGCAYNAANILGRGGAPVTFVTPVGLQGVFGTFVRDRLQTLPFAQPVYLPNAANGCCYCLVEAGGERTFLSIHGAEYSFDPAWMARYAAERYAYGYVCGLEIEEKTGGLLADYLQKTGANAIVKGLRAVSDFEYEFQMALANKKLYNDAETVFLTTTGENMFLSSSVVKEIASFGGDITGFVPKQIQSKITDRLYKPANNIDQ